MSNGGYNYNNDYSDGYDYSQGQSSNNNYDYSRYNYPLNSNFDPHPSTYSQPTIDTQYAHQPLNPAPSLLNNPAAQIGMQFGTQALSAGQEYVNNNVQYSQLFQILFTVTNS